MENIEKRIEAFINTMPNVSVNFRDGSKYGYHNGAVEQLEIDTERACKWLAEFLCETDMNHPTIESLRMAMKGGNE